MRGWVEREEEFMGPASFPFLNLVYCCCYCLVVGEKILCMENDCMNECCGILDVSVVTFLGTFIGLWYKSTRI